MDRSEWSCSDGWLARCTGVVIGLLLLPSLSCAGGRAVEEARQAKARFESSGAAHVQHLRRSPKLQPAEVQALAEVKFVYAPTRRPMTDSVHLFGQRSVVVSDGWMSLVEDVIRADLLATHVNSVSDSCFVVFVARAMSVARDNRKRSGTQRQPPTAIPRWGEFVEAHRDDVCAELVGAAPLATDLDSRTAQGLDAALMWAIGRGLALQIGTEDADPRPSVAASSQETAGPQHLDNEVRCRIEGAESWSIERAAEMRIDLLPGYAGVLIHQALAESKMDAANCGHPRRKLDQFFEALMKSAGDSSERKRSIEAAMRRTDTVWNALE